MASRVKTSGPTSAKVSSKRQLTLPKREMDSAGLEPGATVRVEAVGPGQILVTRLDDIIARYAGTVATDGKARHALDRMRDEWA